jgi:hypothetical protein
MMSIFFNSPMSVAEIKGGASVPTSGALPPGFDVVKK